MKPFNPPRGGPVMRARPLSMCLELVPAVLSGLKTMTRRPLNPQPVQIASVDGTPIWHFPVRGGFVNSNTDGTWPITMTRHVVDQDGKVYPAVCPLGAEGDGLWLRERARVVEYPGYMVRLRYEADGTEDVRGWPDRLKHVEPGRCIPNGVHKDGARWQGEIVEVRVERVQDISEEDARAEGFIPLEDDPFEMTAKDLFRHTWLRLYGPGAWDRNDWVWAVRWKEVQ